MAALTNTQGTIVFDLQAQVDSKRKYICRTCSRAFKRGEHCVRHERRHTQEKPYVCEICDSRYIRKDIRDLLVRHQRTIHGAEKPPPRTKAKPVTCSPSSKIIPPTSPSVPPILVDINESPNNHDTTAPDTEPIQPRSQAEQSQENFKRTNQDFSVINTQHDLYDDANGEWTLLTDPFIDWSSQEMAEFALPHLNSQLLDGFSPLEELSNSSVSHNDLTSITGSKNMDGCHTLDRIVDADISISLKVDCSLPSEARNRNSASKIRFNDDLRKKLLADISMRVSHELLQYLIPFPASLYDRCLQRYFGIFNTHTPLFHVPSLDIFKIPAPLILSMCAIGAIYRMERKVAATFYNTASQSLESLDTGNRPSLHGLFLQDWMKPGNAQSNVAPDLLWMSQTKLLLAIFENLSGDRELSSKAIHQLGFFVSDFRDRLIWLQPHNARHDHLSWESWIERESVKRLMYGYIYLCNLLTTIFGFASGFSMLTDGDIEMPSHHSLWDAPDAISWKDAANARGSHSPLRLKDAISRLLNGKYRSTDIPTQYWEWDPYSCNVAVNAVSIYISHMTQGLYVLGESSDEPHSFQVSNITSQMETAISRCLHLIKDARVKADESYTWNDTEGPLLFNSLATLRVSYCKIITRAESASRGMLFRLNENEAEQTIQHFLSAPLERTEYLNRAVSVALEGILIPTRVGSGLVRKTAAFTWAIEHAFAGWDSVLLLTKWLHAKEILQCQGHSLGEAEIQIVQRVSDMLAEDVEFGLDNSNKSTAATLAKYWAGFYDDVWVWGVTPKMGRMLRLLADEYERRLDRVVI